MSKTSVALIVALSVAMTAVSAGAATPPRHSHHGRLLAPGVYPNELIENNAPSYGGGWVGTGQLYTREIRRREQHEQRLRHFDVGSHQRNAGHRALKLLESREASAPALRSGPSGFVARASA